MKRTRYLTTAIVQTYLPSCRAHEETRIGFIRNRCLTMRGMQRLISQGCEETYGEKCSGIVIGLERAVFGK